MAVPFRALVFFISWAALAVIAFVLNVLNIDWAQTNTTRGILILVILAVIQGSVIEFPLIAMFTLLFWNKGRELRRLPADHLSLVLNYNLLAVEKGDVDECLQKMHDAYMGNLSPNVCAVLVSASRSKELRDYEIEVRDNFRAMIYDQLYKEGIHYVERMFSKVHDLRLKTIWRMFDSIDRDIFVNNYLNKVCRRFAKDFMVIHRVSRVLRKCGQYQDLMLLSRGADTAYTYTDRNLYSDFARTTGEPLFHPSDDVDHIYGRCFDYTLVLDGDTAVPSGAAIKLLEVAAGHPERAIIQPAIKLDCTGSDTIFMHLESMRQSLYEPMTNTIMDIMDQSAYFGKALIKNSVYIETVIGTQDRLIERVPVDVLSHDTFEAALLKPLYAGSVYLLEAPCYNYVSWNIRERRWNKGEVLLSTYFWRNAIGKPMRWLQRRLQGDAFKVSKLRTVSHLDFVTSYIAHSALRQMLMKPLLLIYIMLHYQINLHFRFISVITVMFLVLVFPKFCIISRDNYKLAVVETLASIVQFTPEAVVGSVRIITAIQANICASVSWVPQRQVEMEFKSSNPFKSALSHLWTYAAFSLVTSIALCVFFVDALYILVILASLVTLPFYTGFTSLTPSLRSTNRTSYPTDVEARNVNVSSFENSSQKRNGFKCLHVFDTCFMLDDSYIKNRRKS